MTNLEPRRILILGSTGSIGTQTLDVVRHLNAVEPDSPIEIAGLAAGRSAEALQDQARQWRCPVASTDPGRVDGAPWHVTGPDAAAELIRRAHDEGPIDLVVGAIVGFAGLGPTLTSLGLGIDVAIANKETLVAAGELVLATANRTGARLLPVDSEHSALWQCLTGLARSDSLALPPIEPPHEVVRMILTASGGALRDWPADQIAGASPADALAHPTWTMGPKVTIDSATLMNKGFEAMEARWLFGLTPDRLGVLIHPTSTVHSLVEMTDGAILAQLGTPDMRTAIQYAILRGRHAPRPASDRLDLAALARLEFREPNADRFPMLGYAFDALRTGGSAGAILNAANEEAVRAFLDSNNADGSRMRLGRIPDLVQDAIESIPVGPVDTLDAIIAADAAARDHILARL